MITLLPNITSIRVYDFEKKNLLKRNKSGFHKIKPSLHYT